MAKFESTETRKIAVTSTDKSQDFLSVLTGVYLVADGDCFVDFDRPAVANSSFLIKANLFYPLEKIHFTQLHAIASGTANLYILGTRGSTT